MSKILEEYSPAEFKAQFTRIKKGLSLGLPTQNRPKGFLLGGQSGAGKTRLQKMIMKKFGYDFVVINGDEYRSAHPRFAQIQDKYGIDAPAHTAKWASDMVESLVDALSSEGYNLIVEGTLRTSAAPLKTAELLCSRGYAVHLAVMAVKPEISLVSCQIRYEQMRIAGTTPRAVDPKHHAKIVADIASNLATLERSGAFETVSLYNRAGSCLYTGNYPCKDTPASTVLSDVLFGDWTQEETKHFQELTQQLEGLRAGE